MLKTNVKIPTHMPIPVRFYSVTAEEYEEIRKKIEEAKSKETMTEEEKSLENGIFFVDDNNNNTEVT